MKRILVALSGGVDSAVAALRLKQAGYDITGAYMRTWINEEGSPILADCPWMQDIEDAKTIAEQIGIKFEIINLIQDYRERVVSYLVDGYKKGITPNPDIMCNKEMKFGIFLAYAKDMGFDGIATGHYCRKITNTDGSCSILEGIDKNKDQSYFLSLITQNQIKDALFPIGELEKQEVRKIAKTHKLVNAEKKDSQGICFLGKVNINDFLKQYIPDKPGQITNTEGKALGEHLGLHRYTIGQRKGIGVPSNADFERYVVVRKDYEKNHLVVAFEKPDTPGLWTKTVIVQNLSFIGKPISKTKRLLAKPRYRDPSTPIEFIPLDNGFARIEFEKKQRALAPGQIIALYEGDELLGGGPYSQIY